MKKNKQHLPAVLVISILAFFAVAVFFAYTSYLNRYFRNEMKARLLHTVEQSRNDIEITIKHTFTVLTTIARSISSFSPITGVESLQLLREQFNLYDYGLMLIITPDGIGYGSNDKTYTLGDREYFKKALIGDQIIMQMGENRQSGVPSVVLAVPIKQKDRILGVLAFGFPDTQFKNLLKNNMFSTEAVSYIMLADGTIITKTETTDGISEIEAQVFSKEILARDARNKNTKKSGFYRIGNLRFFASYAQLTVSDWYLLTLIPATVYFSQWSHLLFVSSVAFFILAAQLFILVVIVFFMQQASAENLRQSEERYRIVSEQANEVIFEWNLAEDTLVLPEKTQKKFELVPEGINFRDSWYKGDYVYEDDKENFIQLFSAAAKGVPYGEDVYRRKKIDGTYGWVRTRITTLFDAQKKPYKVVGVSFDVDSEVTENLALRARAERDSLTELFNKGFTNTLISGILAESSSKKNRHAFFLIDIDSFKSINDTLGHLFGDDVLRSIGQKLAKTFRQQDVAGRVGGDEFAVFLRDIDSDNIIIERAKKLQEVFKSERTGKDKSFKVSGSIGIALYPQHGTTYAELYKKADDALYTAKHAGKDCYRIYGNE